MNILKSGQIGSRKTQTKNFRTFFFQFFKNKLLRTTVIKSNNLPLISITLQTVEKRYSRRIIYAAEAIKCLGLNTPFWLLLETFVIGGNIAYYAQDLDLYLLVTLP